MYPDFARRGPRKPVKVKESINRLESVLLELSERNEASLGSEKGDFIPRAHHEQGEETGQQRPQDDVQRQAVVRRSTTKWDSILEDVRNAWYLERFRSNRGLLDLRDQGLL